MPEPAQAISLRDQLQGRDPGFLIDEAQAARVYPFDSPPVPGTLVGVAFLGDYALFLRGRPRLESAREIVDR